MQNIYTIQENKTTSDCKNAYIFKGLGLNLIPFSPDEKQLQKIRMHIKEMLDNAGKESRDDIIDKVIEKTPKIGLDISLMQRKFVEALTIVIGNSTLMDLVQSNKYYRNKNHDHKIINIDYNNLCFKVPIRYINKLFGRSILEKMGKDKKNIIEQLSNKTCFLINNKGKIIYAKPFLFKIEDEDLIFSFASFLIGQTYDKRKDFFKNIKTNYEALFFEKLFQLTKDFKKKVVEKWYFTTRSLLEDIGMSNYAYYHKKDAICLLNKCFAKGKEIGILIDNIQYTKDNFKHDDKTKLIIHINKDFKWYD